MSKANRRHRTRPPSPKPSPTPRTIEIAALPAASEGVPEAVADVEATDGKPEGVSSEPTLVTPVPAIPSFECTTSVFSDKVVLAGVDPSVGSVRTGKNFLGWNTASVVPKDGKSPTLVVMSSAPKAMRTAAKTWGRKWLDRLCALALWLIFMSYLFRDVGLVGQALNAAGAHASWEPWILMALVAALLLILPRRGGLKALLASLYIVFFPVVAFFIVLAKVVGAIVIFKRITGALGSFTFRGANWLFMITCCAAIAKTSSSTVIHIASAYLIVGTIYLVASNFYWVTRPLSTVFRILDWLDESGRSRMTKFRSDFSDTFQRYREAVAGNDEKRVEATQKQLVSLIGDAKGWVWIASLVNGKLRRVVAPVVLFYLFATRFLGSVALIVVVFASLYLGIAKDDATTFAGQGISGFADALYFSVVTFFTVGFGDITPASSLAKWCVIAQIATALTMLTLLALSFSTLSAQTATAATDRMEARAKEFLDELTKVLRRHFRIEGKPLEEVLEELKKNPRTRWRER